MPKHYHMKAETGKIFYTPEDANMKVPKSFTFPVIPQPIMLEKKYVTFNLRIPMMGAFINRRSATIIKKSTGQVIAETKIWQINSYLRFKIYSNLMQVGVEYLVTIK
jgi:hypothetical protein